MTRPIVVVEMAFTSNPLDTVQNFVAIPVQYINRIDTIKRGRQRLLDRNEAGTLQLRLWDKDRLFDPKNTASPYYPNVTPRKQIRVGVTGVPGLAGTKYLFTGFIETLQPIEENRERYVNVRATDGFKYLASTKRDISRPREGSKGRIQYILDSVGWPKTLIQTGQSLMEGVTLYGVTPLQHILDCVTTENGEFFIDGDGNACFHGRQWRLTTATSQTSQAIFGDANVSTELSFERINDSHDDSLLANHVTTTLNSAQIGVADDITSQNRYMRSDLTRELPLLTSNNEGVDAAYWILKQRANLADRVESITLDGDASDAVLYQVFVRDIDNRITVKLYPNHDPTQIPWIQDHYIESLSWDLSRQAPRVTWTLSVTDFDNYFRADDAVYGRADYNAAAY